MFKQLFEQLKVAQAKQAEQVPPSPFELLFRQVQQATEAEYERASEQMAQVFDSGQGGPRRRFRKVQGLSNG